MLLSYLFIGMNMKKKRYYRKIFSLLSGIILLGTAFDFTPIYASELSFENITEDEAVDFSTQEKQTR